MKSVLINEILRFPKGIVSQIETRYPTKPAEMRAFLIKFFTRDYFQTQDSIIDYMTSQDFLNTITSGRLRILDVGSGPAVASLAIVENAFLHSRISRVAVGAQDGQSNLCSQRHLGHLP